MTTSKRFTVPDCRSCKAQGIKLSVVTAYDFTAAQLLEHSPIEIILVGDSLGMVIQGHETSLPVTLDEMVYHTRCVVRGTQTKLVVADLPFLTYQVSPEQALISAGKLIQEGGAHCVKLEGGTRSAPAIQKVVEAGIPVMGHVGMTPQSVREYGGFKVQRNYEQILLDAQAVERAGAFSIVLECIPRDLAKEITSTLSIPTIGIGAGPDCDGQVLVFHDLLGMLQNFRPKFVKPFANLTETIGNALTLYDREVKAGSFPGDEHSFR